MELHNLAPEDRKASTVILGLSPDPLDKVKNVVAKVTARTNREFGVTLLADPDHRVIDQYGLRNEEAAQKGRFLPHPTTYVIDGGGVVRWKFTEVNYKIRPANEMILKELEKLPK